MDTAWQIPDLTIVQTISFLLPGFAAAWIFYGFTAHPKKTPFDRVVQALIFTALIHSLNLVLREALLALGRSWIVLGVWNSESALASSTGLGVIFGVVLSWLANIGWPHSVLPD